MLATGSKILFVLGKMMRSRNKSVRFSSALFACVLLLACVAESLAGTADKTLRLGARLSLNSVGEITDAPWGVYADGVGSGATLSFDALYQLSNRFALHPSIGIDYRYFVSDDQQVGVGCDGCTESLWKGDNKDYLLYLEIPVMAQFQIPEIIYFEAGFVFDFMLMRHSDYFEPKEFRNDRCHDDRFFGAGLSVGLGHEFSFGLFVDVHLSYQLTDVVTVNKTCGSYTVSGWNSRTDNATGTESVEKEFEYIDEGMVGSYYVFNKIQLGVGYWF